LDGQRQSCWHSLAGFCLSGRSEDGTIRDAAGRPLRAWERAGADSRCAGYAAEGGMGQRMIEANGVELSAEAFGDPRVLRSVLIMGIGASMLWWEQGFCGMLADGGRFVIVTTTATPALGDLRARTPRVRRRRPAFARFLYLRYRGLQRELDAYLEIYNHHRAHTGRITAGRHPAQLIYGARKMEPMSRTCRHIPESVQPKPRAHAAGRRRRGLGAGRRRAPNSSRSARRSGGDARRRRPAHPATRSAWRPGRKWEPVEQQAPSRPRPPWENMTDTRRARGRGGLRRGGGRATLAGSDSEGNQRARPSTECPLPA